MLSTLLLQADQTASTTTGSSPVQFILLGAIVVVFYFFIIRPQKKRGKEQKSFLENMKKGDSVITIGGIHGIIDEIKQNTITLDINQQGTKMVFMKSAISLDNSKKNITTKKQ